MWHSRMLLIGLVVLTMTGPVLAQSTTQTLFPDARRTVGSGGSPREYTAGPFAIPDGDTSVCIEIDITQHTNWGVGWGLTLEILPGPPWIIGVGRGTGGVEVDGLGRLLPVTSTLRTLPAGASRTLSATYRLAGAALRSSVRMVTSPTPLELTDLLQCPP